MNINFKEIKTFSLEKLRGKWGVAVGVSFVASILGGNGGGGFGGSSRNRENLDYLMQEIPPEVRVAIIGVLAVIGVWALIVSLIGPVIELGQNKFFLKLCRDEPVYFSDLFSKFSSFWKAFALRLVMNIFIVLWMLLLIIPGIIAAFRYSMAMYILADNPEIGIMDAISESKELMKGHKMDFFLLQLSFLGWILLGALAFGIGLFFVIPYINTANAAFYLTISNSRETNYN